MIGYRISRADIERSIDKHDLTWLARAQERTSQFRKQKKYQETSSIWSQVKVVYMKLQGESKCVYCERKLEAIEYGKGEQAVEHFRPKGNVKPWKLPKSLQDQSIAVAIPPAGQGGYYLLPYDVFNYAASCNPCNSALKRDYFPVAGKHRLDGTSPEALSDERPLLIYPIGDFDDPPETLIDFHGVSPRAAAAAGHERHRALVTIEFFQLDSLSRKNLVQERARIIISLFPALQTLADQSPKRDLPVAREIVDAALSPHAPHTNCARCFHRLFKNDPQEAHEIYTRAAKLLSTSS